MRKQYVVALLTEGVDRNMGEVESTPWMPVALLTEGVDRNIATLFSMWLYTPSPSSRRAWIEIPEEKEQAAKQARVALLTEGVDRNIYVLTLNFSTFRRPPHGGRG